MFFLFFLSPCFLKTKFEVYEEEAEVETDEEVEEIVEKEVIKDVVQEIKVPQVKALHPFSGQGLKMAKGEVGGWMTEWCS